SFSWERFEERYNSELANALGNLASRTIAMVEKYCGGVVPAGEPNDVDAADARDYAAYHSAMEGSRGYLLHEALKSIWATVSRGNEFVDRQAPWKLAKDPSKSGELAEVLASLIRQLARHAAHLAPFMPGKSQELWSSLGAPGNVRALRFDGVDELVVSGWRVKKGAPLFPKEIMQPTSQPDQP
ncbi:MAG: methionine--tRNA ligase, partial [Gemmatimonadaceae bacterium]